MSANLTTIQEQLAVSWDQNLAVWIAWASDLKDREDRAGMSAMVQELWRRERNTMYLAHGAAAMYDSIFGVLAMSMEKMDPEVYQQLHDSIRKKMEAVENTSKFWAKAHAEVSHIQGCLEVQLQRDEIAMEIAKYAAEKR